MKLGWSYFAAAVKLRRRHETVREFVARELRLSTKPRMKVSIDGEIGAETPLDISAIPDAVTIAAPIQRG